MQARVRFYKKADAFSTYFNYVFDDDTSILSNPVPPTPYQTQSFVLKKFYLLYKISMHVKHQDLKDCVRLKILKLGMCE